MLNKAATVSWKAPVNSAIVAMRSSPGVKPAASMSSCFRISRMLTSIGMPHLPNRS